MSNLVYNTCWEDPRVDRQLLKLDADSKVVMITSAGCNALDYSLDSPKAVHCVDMNYRQNALLELKKATIRNNDYTHHFEMFGQGADEKAEQLYGDSLRKLIPAYAQNYWDKKVSPFFNAKKNNGSSFYFKGTSGQFAWLFKQYFDANKPLRRLVVGLINSQDAAEQRVVYEQLEPKLMSKFMVWAMSRHLTMAMLGVPRAQQELITKKYPEGMAGFLKDRLRHVFTQLPVQENYFWRLYIMGKYSENTCPEYLKKENYPLLRLTIDKLQLHTNSISGFLQENPGHYTHYVLLDHQDWLANHNPEALVQEWKLILKNSRPGTKILMRSAATQINFLPKFVTDSVVFDLEKGKSYHAQDRVGTYGSTYIGQVVHSGTR